MPFIASGDLNLATEAGLLGAVWPHAQHGLFHRIRCTAAGSQPPSTKQ